MPFGYRTRSSSSPRWHHGMTYFDQKEPIFSCTLLFMTHDGHDEEDNQRLQAKVSVWLLL